MHFLQSSSLIVISLLLVVAFDPSPRHFYRRDDLAIARREAIAQTYDSAIEHILKAREIYRR
jgi:hypothetical protein